MNDVLPTIRQLRKQAGLRQEDLADLAEVSLSSVIRAEQGEYNPKRTIHTGTAYLICRALGVEVNQVRGLNMYSGRKK